MDIVIGQGGAAGIGGSTSNPNRDGADGGNTTVSLNPSGPQYVLAAGGTGGGWSGNNGNAGGTGGLGGSGNIGQITFSGAVGGNGTDDNAGIGGGGGSSASSTSNGVPGQTGGGNGNNATAGIPRSTPSLNSAIRASIACLWIPGIDGTGSEAWPSSRTNTG